MPSREAALQFFRHLADGSAFIADSAWRIVEDLEEGAQPNAHRIRACRRAVDELIEHASDLDDGDLWTSP
jgi:hypothetical protein